MQMQVTPRAHRWFNEEIAKTPEQGIRFFGKIYGNTAVHEGFSIGMSVEVPERPLVIERIEGTSYFIEETDEWFFNGYDLLVDYDAQKEEPSYSFMESSTSGQ